jgi:quinol monooxygenase YgiN
VTADVGRHETSQHDKENEMLLATTQVEDFDRFMAVFSDQGAEKRRQHGSKGAVVFRDPTEDDRVWVVFDWDEEGWQSFVSDPEVPAIMKEAGHIGKPQPAAFAGRCSG